MDLGEDSMEVGRGDMGVPPLSDVMMVARIEEIYMYVSRQHNTVAQYIATCPIFDLCLDTGERPGSQAPKRWW